MNNEIKRAKSGPIEALIFDNAGTIVDFGCIAPVMAFVEIFKRRGVEITVAEARGPMGAAKRDHIVQLLEMETVQSRWQAQHNAPSQEADIDAMYADFLPLQIDCLKEYSEVISGAKETFETARQAGLKIATTTGYPTAVMEALSQPLEAQGLVPDLRVCADDVRQGRPYPDMCLEAAMGLGVKDLAACVNIDDSAPGLQAGLAAGMWTIGLSCSGNEVGLSEAEWRASDEEERGRLADAAAKTLAVTGVHYIVDTISDIGPCLEDIDARLAAGERP